jgi:hypothetical protein
MDTVVPPVPKTPWVQETIRVSAPANGADKEGIDVLRS